MHDWQIIQHSRHVSDAIVIQPIQYSFSFFSSCAESLCIAIYRYSYLTSYSQLQCTQLVAMCIYTYYYNMISGATSLYCVGDLLYAFGMSVTLYDSCAASQDASVLVCSTPACLMTFFFVAHIIHVPHKSVHVQRSLLQCLSVHDRVYTLLCSVHFVFGAPLQYHTASWQPQCCVSYHDTHSVSQPSISSYKLNLICMYGCTQFWQ